jgi:hypothetical protein
MSLDDAFFEGQAQVGSLTLRPFTIGSMTACRKLGLTLFTGEATDTTPDDVQRQVVAFAWLQSTPVAKVLACLRDNSAQAAIDAFEWALKPSDLPLLEAEINRISQSVGAAAVDVVQRDVTPDPQQPGN